MEKMNNKYGCEVPSLKEITLFLANCNSPLGDLCNDMLNDIYIDFNDREETLFYLDIISEKGEYIEKPIRAFKKICEIIYEE